MRNINFDELSREDFFSGIALHALLGKGHLNRCVDTVKNAINIGSLMASAQKEEGRELTKQFMEVHDTKLRQDKEIVHLKNKVKDLELRQLLNRKYRR